MRSRLVAVLLGLALAGPVFAADPFPGLKTLALPGYFPAAIHYRLPQGNPISILLADGDGTWRRPPSAPSAGSRCR